MNALKMNVLKMSVCKMNGCKMNAFRKLRTPALIYAAFLLCALTGCSGGKAGQAAAPFSSLTWDSSPEDLKQLEGEAKESYDSNYNGTTYVYDGEYQGRNGTLKYMFDADEKLMCIAWAYIAADADDLDAAYTSIHAEIVAAHGESGYHPSGSTNYGDVWYRAEGDIILSALTVEGQSAMQYAYLNPKVSNQEALSEQ